MKAEYFLIGAAVMNIVTFIVYASDKCRAVSRKRRTREFTLLLLAALYGAFGALLAMLLFRHKTKHREFVLLVPIFLILQIGLLIMYFPQLPK